VNYRTHQANQAVRPGAEPQPLTLPIGHPTSSAVTGFLDATRTAATTHWFAVCCKPRQEAVAEENLLRQGFHVYLPRIRVRKRYRGQWNDAVVVLFPRYIFIKVDPLRHSTAAVRSTRGVVGLVRFGGQPAVVPDAVMDALRQREDAVSGLHQDNLPLFCAGESVRLVDGPLTGMEGVFTQQDGDKRVFVLLEMLGQANRVSVSRDWIARAA
jgi:transcriptional antiterminator RfaH